ncbi:uncharacterized protein G2W53_041716 [Senna tora]|uniref:Uncharacterized protein n=1 Tax=Senna tora TaxID=362788 RepID=A0A834SHG9_9FABA|nr:uncharacterized protein G2W53_041716 [Senna tora]
MNVAHQVQKKKNTKQRRFHLQNNLSPPPPCHQRRAPIQCDSDNTCSTFPRLRTDLCGWVRDEYVWD